MNVVLQTVKLGSPPWPTVDPFLFCVHHLDRYPAGDAQLGLSSELLRGRSIGNDFSGRDGWSMYHGQHVPGFPQHPHRGFETVTLARHGFIDHSDSLGATARFGRGDVQWMTAGAGIVHCEMFPMLNGDDAGNHTELFQIWLNLAASDKMVPPYFTMLWNETIPHVRFDGGEVVVVAGAFGDAAPGAPPPNSWASRAEADVAIWTIRVEAGATVTLPPAASADAVRTMYSVEGGDWTANGELVAAGHAAVVDSEQSLSVTALGESIDLLMLQGRPIGEPVAQYGPFVMNTQAEIEQAFADYRATEFGGWPWHRNDPVHGSEVGRFAMHADGRFEEAGAR